MNGEGWHRDPVRRFHERWWDGERWTDRVRTSTGTEQTDPAPTSAEIAAAVQRRAPRAEAAAGGFALPPGAARPPSTGRYVVAAIVLLLLVVGAGLALT